MKSGWEIRPLGDVCDFRRGLTYGKGDEVDAEGTAVLRAMNIDLDNGELDLTDIRYIAPSIEVPKNKMVAKGTLLICTASGSKKHLGKTAFIDKPMDFAFGGFMGLLVPSNAILPEFLQRILRSDDYWQFIDQLSNGTNINNLKFSQLSAFPIPLPPLEEQRRIVAVLDEAFEGLARARAHAEANLQNARELFLQALKMQYLNASGTESALGDVCELYQPQTISMSEMRDDAPFVVYGANGPIGRYERYNHEEPQLLITCRGATCGSVNISEPFSWITGNAMVVRPRSENVTRSFLEFLFRGAVNLDGVITGAAQPQITRKSLAPVLIKIPNLKTQNLLVQSLEQIATATNQLQDAYSAQLQSLDDLRQSLLKKAFAGELT